VLQIESVDVGPVVPDSNYDAPTVPTNSQCCKRYFGYFRQSVKIYQFSAKAVLDMRGNCYFWGSRNVVSIVTRFSDRDFLK